MAALNIDVLLSLLARLSWAFFIIYVIVLTIRAIIQHGFVRAGLQLLTFQVLIPLLIPIALSLLSMSIVFVMPQQTAVIVSVMSPGGARPEAIRAGLHVLIPFLEYEALYPISWQTYTMSVRVGEGDTLGDDSISARTSDGQEVLLDTSVIFRIDQEQAVTIYIDWQDRYIEDFIRPVIRGYVRQQVSQFTVEEVNSSARADLEALLDRLLKEEFADKGIILDQFLLRNVSFTEQYAAAVEQKQVALEGQLRTQYEAQQEINLATGHAAAIEIEAAAKANAIELEAQARSNSLKLIADALAADDQLLTYSYIDKLSPSIQVMLLPNDSPFLFPLPDMQPQVSITDTVSALLDENTPTVIDDAVSADTEPVNEPPANAIPPTLPPDAPVQVP